MNVALYSNTHAERVEHNQWSTVCETPVCNIYFNVVAQNTDPQVLHSLAPVLHDPESPTLCF